MLGGALPPCADPAGELGKLLSGAYPDAGGRFGPFGGRFVPETLMGAMERLERAFAEAMADAAFVQSVAAQGRAWIGRPTPVMVAENLSRAWSGGGGGRVVLKREDLAHTGAHKINNALGQALLARRLGVERVIAETGAGQHGVATAAACARLGLPCRVYMGAVDVARQAPNVQRMRWLGAEVVAVQSGDRTLRAAVDEAFREWVRDPERTHYILGSAIGAHPFPLIVRTFQSVIGREARSQALELLGRLPEAAVACVGGGSNAIGFFHGFLGDGQVELLGAEAGGVGVGVGQHAATIAFGRPGVLHGCHSMLLQDAHGQVQDTRSICAGLDYPGVGPEHAFLSWIGRARYEPVQDAEALGALEDCCRLEGILPALEPSHALALARRWLGRNPSGTVLVNLCGRGDKDMPILMRAMEARAPDGHGADGHGAGAGGGGPGGAGGAGGGTVGVGGAASAGGGQR
ncbi:MAG: tryptophan synthase subunit beta [Planctomyces sp.]|nr:tryptophan synthase subunit beta [Planctomyces sp.]